MKLIPNTKEYKVYSILVKYAGRVLRKHNENDFDLNQVILECISELTKRLKGA